MTALSANDLDWFAARLSIAVYDTIQDEHNAMSLFELKQALKDIPGIEDLTIGYAEGGNQVLHLGNFACEVGPMASNEEIRVALQNPFIKTENTHMSSITGATHLADSIKAKIQAAKDRMASATTNTDAALAKLNTAADAADQVSNSIAKEADDLMAQIGQFSNGAPA